MKTAGQRTRALVEFVDIYPTLAELGGLPLPATSRRHELRAAARRIRISRGRRPPSANTCAPASDKFMGRTIRTDRWRYTEWRDPKQQPRAPNCMMKPPTPRRT